MLPIHVPYADGPRFAHLTIAQAFYRTTKQIRLDARFDGDTIGECWVQSHLVECNSYLLEVTGGRFPADLTHPSAEIVSQHTLSNFKTIGLRQLLCILALDAARAMGNRYLHCLVRPVAEDSRFLARLGFTVQSRCRFYAHGHGDADLFAGMTMDLATLPYQSARERLHYLKLIRLFGFEVSIEPMCFDSHNAVTSGESQL